MEYPLCTITHPLHEINGTGGMSPSNTALTMGPGRIFLSSSSMAALIYIRYEPRASGGPGIPITGTLHHGRLQCFPEQPPIRERSQFNGIQQHPW